MQRPAQGHAPQLRGAEQQGQVQVLNGPEAESRHRVLSDAIQLNNRLLDERGRAIDAISTEVRYIYMCIYMDVCA